MSLLHNGIYNDGMHNWESGNWIGMIVGGLISLLFLVLVIVLIAVMIRKYGGPGMHGDPAESH